MCIQVIQVEIGRHWSYQGEIVILLRKQGEKHSPTRQEKAVTPDRFRCYCCWEVKGKKLHLGGRLADKPICRKCYPFLDERAVLGMIWFDEKHGFRVD